MAEAMELRAFYARYPFDDESNHWLPHGMLQAQIAGLTGGDRKPSDYMPFLPKDEPDAANDSGRVLLNNWKDW